MFWKYANLLRSTPIIQVPRNGHTTHFRPCPHHFEVKEKPIDIMQISDVTPILYDDNLSSSVFCSTHNDNKVILSVEDTQFMGIKDK